MGKSKNLMEKYPKSYWGVFGLKPRRKGAFQPILEINWEDL